MQPIPDKLLVAMKVFGQKFPYLKRIPNNLVYVSEPQCPTAGVDKYWRFYYNPKFIEVTPEEELTSLIFHESFHLFARHHMRLQSWHPTIGNIAGDFVGNSTILEQGLKEIKIRDENGNILKVPVDDKPNGKTQSAKWQLPENWKFPKGLTEEEYCLLLEEKATYITTSCMCGSGATGTQQPWEIPDGNSTSDGENEGMGEADQKIIREQVAKDIIETEEKNRGTCPADMVRLANEIIMPKANFLAQINSLLKSSRLLRGKERPTYKRMSKNRYLRKLYPKIVFPGRAVRQSIVGFIIDTSGSMSNTDLAKCLGTVKRSIQDNPIQAIVGTGDAGLHNVKEIDDWRQIKMVGGGGTSMRQLVIDFQSKYKTDLLCILTDCETDWPEEQDLKQRTAVIGILHRDSGNGGVPNYLKFLRFNRS